MGAQRSSQSDFVEQGRPQAERERAHRLKQLLDHRQAIIQPQRLRRRVVQSLRLLDFHLGRGETLPDLVMQFASKVMALLLLDGKEPVGEQLPRLLDSTLIVWCGEFGRTPDNGVRGGTAYGRDHNPQP